MLVDMNGDGSNEVVLYCSPESTQVLHYEEGVVYSYQFVFRGMKRIHQNGVYEGSDGAANTSYHRLTELSNYVQDIESVELAETVEFTEGMLIRCLLGEFIGE